MSTSNPPLRRLSLLAAALLVLAGCDGDDGGQTVDDADTDEVAADDAATEADGSDEVAADDEAPEEDTPDDAPDTGGAGGGGTVTIDGTLVAMDRTMLCEPPDDIGNQDAADLLEELGIEPMNLAASSDEGNLLVSLTVFGDTGITIVSLTWTDSDGTYIGSFMDLDGSGEWLLEDTMEPAGVEPLQTTGDRATGEGPLEGRGGLSDEPPIDLEFDLEVPTEVGC